MKRCSLARVKVCGLSNPENRRQSNVLTAKSNVERLRQHASTAWAVWMGKHKHRVFASLLQLLQAATGLLEENMLPLLQYQLILRVNKVLMICKFWTATSLFFLCEIKFSVELARSCCQPKQLPYLCSIFQSLLVSE